MGQLERKMGQLDRNVGQSEGNVGQLERNVGQLEGNVGQLERSCHCQLCHAHLTSVDCAENIASSVSLLG